MAVTARCAVIALGCSIVACSRSEVPRPRAEPETRGASQASSHSASPTREAAPPSSAIASAERDDTGLPPLEPSEPLVALEVPGAAPAIVSLPNGATTPRPVVVALHGNYDRPEWQCEVWRGIVGTRGFILCPRGVPRRDVSKNADRWEYASLAAVEAEVDAGLQALAARFGRHVDPGPVLFIGFSLGAIYGSPLVQRRPERFPRVVLVEGGLGPWTRPNAKKFAEKGGLRLLIACGQAGCLAQGKQLGSIFEKVGLPTRSGGHPKAGHTYDGEVAAVVAREFAWLTEGDPRWGPP